MKRSAVNTRSQKPKKFISQSIITSTNVNTTYMKNFEEKRLQTAESILDFHFSKKRVRILSKTTEVKEHSKGIVYWMSREGRVQDNWSLLFAQKLALKNSLPLCICFCLVPELQATLRHYKFMLKGLQELEEDCKNLNINFNLLIGSPSEQIPLFVNTNKIGAVVCDFSPLRISQEWVKNVENNLPIDVPLCQVDGHNIVPVWIVSDKQEYAARTIRNKINEKLQIFLTEFPPVIKHSITSNSKSGTPIDWEKIYNSLECNLDIDEVDWAKPGYREACKELERFCEIRLKDYNNKRNDPLGNALSNLSPWFHFGQISIQRCILTVKRFKLKYPESVEAFCEEAIVRRELSDNFCYYNKQYDNLNGLAPWAYKTLDEHRKDERIYIYTRDELEQSKTHDDLWNSTQIQLVREGKIHGFLRMYWAKKILEWTKSPEEALQIAIDLNDKYSLDGNDPNGYVGCMWSIGGIHDQGWKERPIFGKIRYMNYEGCKRKFDVNAFVARYGGKVFNKT